MSQGKRWTKEQKEKIVQSLKPYFKLNYSVKKACTLAQFPDSTFYKWVEDDPDLGARIRAWQGIVSAKARENIATAIVEGNITQSNWWAERRERDEFSTKQIKTEEVEVKHDLSKEAKKELNDLKKLLQKSGLRQAPRKSTRR